MQFDHEVVEAICGCVINTSSEVFIRTMNQRAAGGTVRYHTEHMMPKQTIAQHSWNMALLANEVYPGDATLVLACLLHDTGEGFAGDIPAPAKWHHTGLKIASNVVESEAREQLKTNITLTEQQQRQLKTLDYLELCLFCLEQVILGNLYAETIYNRIRWSLLEEFWDKENRQLQSIIGMMSMMVARIRR